MTYENQFFLKYTPVLIKNPTLDNAYKPDLIRIQHGIPDINQFFKNPEWDNGYKPVFIRIPNGITDINQF